MTFFHQASEYFLRNTRVTCSLPVILLLNVNLDHVGLYDVDSLCSPAERGSSSSSAGLFFALKKNSVCSNSYRLMTEALTELLKA